MFYPFSISEVPKMRISHFANGLIEMFELYLLRWKLCRSKLGGFMESRARYFHTKTNIWFHLHRLIAHSDKWCSRSMTSCGGNKSNSGLVVSMYWVGFKEAVIKFQCVSWATKLLLKMEGCKYPRLIS